MLLFVLINVPYCHGQAFPLSDNTGKIEREFCEKENHCSFLQPCCLVSSVQSVIAREELDSDIYIARGGGETKKWRIC